MPEKHYIKILSKTEIGEKILNLMEYSLYANNKNHIKQRHTTQVNKDGTYHHLYFSILFSRF